MSHRALRMFEMRAYISIEFKDIDGAGQGWIGPFDTVEEANTFINDKVPQITTTIHCPYTAPDNLASPDEFVNMVYGDDKKLLEKFLVEIT